MLCVGSQLVSPPKLKKRKVEINDDSIIKQIAFQTCEEVSLSLQTPKDMLCVASQLDSPPKLKKGNVENNDDSIIKQITFHTCEEVSSLLFLPIDLDDNDSTSRRLKPRIKNQRQSYDTSIIRHLFQ